MYRVREGELEVYLAHPGGPFFAAKDDGFWGIPKGLVEPSEDLQAAAAREFEEETGVRPEGPFIALGSVKLPSGKVVHAWAFRRDGEPPALPRSNTFELEWPPRSGNVQAYPEIDQARFFSIGEAERKVGAAQREFLDRLARALA